jgi:fatty acid-binding protein DegV
MPVLERVASVLRVKPIIEMCDGEFRFLGVARSTRGALQRIEEGHCTLNARAVGGQFILTQA